jgi:hypothetical protein
MHALAGNMLQFGMLGAGVLLLLMWINHLRGQGERNSLEERERPAEVRVISAARGRSAP